MYGAILPQVEAQHEDASAVPTLQLYKERADDLSTIDLGRLKAEALYRQEHTSFDVRSLDALRVTERGGGLFANTRLGEVPFTNWSFSQLAASAGAPAAYLGTLPASMAADCLNYSISRAGDKTVKLHVIEGDRPIVSAVTGAGYGKVYDYPVLDGVMSAISDNKSFQLFDGRASDRYINLTLLRVPDHYDLQQARLDYKRGNILNRPKTDDHIMMLKVIHSEVGHSTLTILLGLISWYCLNGRLFAKETVKRLKIRHTKNAGTKFIDNFKPMLKYLMDQDLTEEFSRVLRRAREISINPQEDEFPKRFPQFTAKLITSAVHRAEVEEGRCVNIADFYNGLTSIARDMKYADQATMLEDKATQMLYKLAA